MTKIAPKDFFLQTKGENQVWQESFKALPLWSNWMIWQKISYIHNNPLKAGLADSAKDYKWTSFRGFYLEEPEALLQIDKEWWWADDVQKLERSMADGTKSWKRKERSDLLRQAGAEQPFLTSNLL